MRHSLIAFAFGSYMAMASPPYSAKYRLPLSAMRARARRRRRMHRHLLGLGVVMADALAAEIEQVDAVLLVDRHAVGIGELARLVLHLAEAGPFAGLEIELVVLARILVVGPHLAV